jgi:hypothetical protein
VPIVDFILAGHRAGLDVFSSIRLALSDLSQWDRCKQDALAIERGVMFRLAIMILSIVSVRLLLLSMVIDDLWLDWIYPDRVAVTVMVLLLFCSFYLWWRFNNSRGLIVSSDRYVMRWIRDYMILSPEGAGCKQVSRNLRSVFRSQIMDGADGIECARGLYLDALGRHVFEMRHRIDRWQTFVVLIEIMLFLVITGGLVFVPLCVWLFSRSGTG